MHKWKEMCFYSSTSFSKSSVHVIWKQAEKFSYDNVKKQKAKRPEIFTFFRFSKHKQHKNT